LLKGGAPGVAPEEAHASNYGPAKSGHKWLPKPNVTTVNQITTVVTPAAVMRILSHMT
jgi:hypothetical protein